MAKSHNFLSRINNQIYGILITVLAFEEAYIVIET